MSNANLLGGGGGGGTPGGSDGQVQYNNGGSFGGASQLYWDDINSRLGLNTTSPATLLDIRGRFFVDRPITSNPGNTNDSCFSISNFFSNGGVNYGEVAIGMGPGGEPYLQSFGGKNLRVNQLGNAVVCGARLSIGGTTTPTGFVDLYASGAIGQRVIGAAAQANPYFQFVDNVGTTLTSFDSAARLLLHAQNEIRFEDAAGGEYVGVKAPATVTTYTLTLPTAVASPGQVLTDAVGDGTLSWSTPSGGSGNSVTTTLSFGGTFTDKAQTVVTGQTWVTTNSEITVQVKTPSGVDPDEMRLLDFKAVVSDLVAATGFTVTLYSEPEATGDYDVMCIGV